MMEAENIGRAYLAFDGFEQELAEELKLRNEGVFTPNKRIFLSRGSQQAALTTPTIWAQTILSNPTLIEAPSIQTAAKHLKKMGLRWTGYSSDFHRRQILIQNALPKFQPKPLTFLEELPSKKFGTWFLLEKDKILASLESSHPLPLGEVFFQEDKTIPPSRAYLKLWELFTIHKIFPEPGSVCLDLGASPGGWSWVLQNLGCTVWSIDKAPLAPNIAKLPNIHLLQQSAFSLSPKDLPQKIDWFFSDIICYPEKLFLFVEKWLPHCKNFVCTIKFQGKTDFTMMDKFQSIPGSKIIHLFNNKHEVTWIKV